MPARTQLRDRRSRDRAAFAGPQWQDCCDQGKQSRKAGAHTAEDARQSDGERGGQHHRRQWLEQAIFLFCEDRISWAEYAARKVTGLYTGLPTPAFSATKFNFTGHCCEANSLSDPCKKGRLAIPET